MRQEKKKRKNLKYKTKQNKSDDYESDLNSILKRNKYFRSVDS